MWEMIALAARSSAPSVLITSSAAFAKTLINSFDLASLWLH